jgi:chaperonin GroEL (HSP60 family)
MKQIVITLKNVMIIIIHEADCYYIKECCNKILNTQMKIYVITTKLHNILNAFDHGVEGFLME